MPKTAIGNVWPGRASRVSTTRFGRVESGDDRPARVAERGRQLAVDPHLGVVVDDDLEDDGAARRVEVADPLGNGDRDPVPVEADPAAGQPQRVCRRA